MVKVDRLPSGSYRARVLDYTDPEGKAHYRSFTGKNKKTVQLEAAQWEAEKTSSGRRKDNITVGEAMEKCVEIKKNVLSPKTYNAYKGYIRNYLDDIKKIKVYELTQEDVQAAINTEAAKHSPKTVRNMHGLLSATLKMFRPAFMLTTVLPQKEKPDITIPTEEHMIELLKLTKGTELEIPVLFGAVAGMRMSEIVGAKWCNVNFSTGILKIDSAVVHGIDNKPIEKKPKTLAGYRDVPLPPYVMEVLKGKYNPEDKYITKLTSDMIYKRYKRALKQVSPDADYTFHELRHYATSVMIMLGIPAKYIASVLGHATEDMVNRIYGHIMDDKKGAFYERLESYYKGIFARCGF